MLRVFLLVEVWGPRGGRFRIRPAVSRTSATSTPLESIHCCWSSLNDFAMTGKGSQGTVWLGFVIYDSIHYQMLRTFMVIFFLCGWACVALSFDVHYAYLIIRINPNRPWVGAGRNKWCNWVQGCGTKGGPWKHGQNGSKFHSLTHSLLLAPGPSVLLSAKSRLTCKPLYFGKTFFEKIQRPLFKNKRQESRS